MGSGRSQYPADPKIARVLFAVKDGKILILSGFIKKTQKTPKIEIETAKKRLREF
ncbi:type II toxin-antitoxin system RelE/ParE family toxin [Tistrella bauzanensis]